MKLARLILTAIAVVLFFGPLIRDSNASHLLHPDWPGHARLHFMWALGFMASSGLANLYYLWVRRPLDVAALELCCAWQACSLLGGFWTAVVLADVYGGTIHDAEHHATIAGISENAAIFGALALILAAVFGYVRLRLTPQNADRSGHIGQCDGADIALATHGER